MYLYTCDTISSHYDMIPHYFLYTLHTPVYTVVHVVTQLTHYALRLYL